MYCSVCSVIFKRFLKKFQIESWSCRPHHDGVKRKDQYNACKIVLGIMQLCCCLSPEMLGLIKKKKSKIYISMYNKIIVNMKKEKKK